MELECLYVWRAKDFLASKEPVENTRTQLFPHQKIKRSIGFI